MDRGIDGWVRAHQHQAQAVVRECGRRIDHRFVRREQGAQRRIIYLPLTPCHLKQFALGHGQKPGLGGCGHTISRSAFKRSGKGIRERVLGGGDVTPLSIEFDYVNCAATRRT